MQEEDNFEFEVLMEALADAVREQVAKDLALRKLILDTQTQQEGNVT